MKTDDRPARPWFTNALLGPLVIFVCDISLAHANVAILYPVALLFHRSLGKRQIWSLAIWLVVLCVLGMICKVYIHALDPNLWHFRIVNRGMITGSLLILAALIGYLDGQGDGGDIEIRSHRDIDGFEKLMYSLRPLMVAAFVILLDLAIFVTDYMSPVQINVSILYLVPLFIMTWCKSPSLSWALAGITAVAAVLGAFVGNCYAPNHASIVMNRFIVAFAAIALTIIATRVHKPNKSLS